MMFNLNEHGRTNWCTRIQRLLFAHGFGGFVSCSPFSFTNETDYYNILKYFRKWC